MANPLMSSAIETWILPALVFWPLLGALGVRLLGRDPEQGGIDARVLTVAVLAVEAVLAIILWFGVDATGSGWQARVDLPWLPDLGARISLGVDGLSLPLVVMTAVIIPLALLGSWNNVRVRTPTFGALVLMLTSGLIGVFLALDLLLFYLAWELMLIPTYLLVGVWSTAGESRASVRYVLFTLVGSLLMLVAIIALWSLQGGTSLHLDDLARLSLSPTAQLWMFGAFFAAFGVKSALVPFHTWLPGAQGAAPTVAAVTLGIKVGAYALLRFAIPLFPSAATDPTVRSVILILATISIVYGAIVAIGQTDLKRIIAYSSISHVGFIILGCFVLTPQSVQGATLSMVSSGVATTALFLLAGMLEDRLGSRDLEAFGGLAGVMPWFSVSLVVAMLATVALPGTIGFVGEFLVLIGAYGDQPVLTIIATSGVIFAAAYGLRATQRILFEPLQESGRALPDLTGLERVVMLVFMAAIVGLGLQPSPVIRRVERAGQTLIETVRFGPNARPALPPMSQAR
jgi:NADH-quinone oxidoreductase subunit M